MIRSAALACTHPFFVPKPPIVKPTNQGGFYIKHKQHPKLSKARVAHAQSLADIDGSVATQIYVLAEGNGNNLSLVYLGTLVVMLLGAAYAVVREVVMRAEMDEAIKRLGDNIRAGNANSEEYFELGAVLIKKKLYLQAIKNFEKSINLWEDDETELAQVYNAIGFCYFNLEKDAPSIKNYKKAVELRPNYVTAWNNLGNVYERTEEWKEAYLAYKEALKFEEDNEIAKERSEFLKAKLDRLGIPA